MSEERIPLLLNTGGGSAPADAAAFAAELDDRLEAEALAGGALADAIARELAGGARTIAVAGGDGTMRTAAEAMLDSGATLAVAPGGTLNHFARRIGIENLEQARAALQGGAAELVPAGTFDNHIFLNTLTFGEYARVLRVRTRYRRFLGKWPAAGLGFASVLLRQRWIDVTLELEDRIVTRRTPLVWVGMGWGSFPLVHEAAERRAQPDLEVAVLRAHGLAGAAFGLRLSARLVRRELPVRDPALEIFHARRITLHARRRLDATADGEIFRLAPPVEIAIRDRAVRVLVPPARPEAQEDQDGCSGRPEEDSR
ncbi:MAG TPA: diacylglycerol kinase family protein [Longimicrobiales bacterium]|nr:diacylglycerol kinase family protein [Longimicrobiales bacterium]